MIIRIKASKVVRVAGLSFAFPVFMQYEMSHTQFDRQIQHHWFSLPR